MLNSAVRLPSSTPSAWKGAQSRAGWTEKMEHSWESCSTVFISPSWARARTEFVKIYTSLTDFFYIWTWLIVTLWWGKKLRLSGWRGTVSTKASFSKWTLRAPVSSLGVWSPYLDRCTSEGTTWFHLGQQPFSLVTSWLSQISNSATIVLKIKVAMVTNSQHD